jgi:hypothetical protein
MVLLRPETHHEQDHDDTCSDNQADNYKLTKTHLRLPRARKINITKMRFMTETTSVRMIAIDSSWGSIASMSTGDARQRKEDREADPYTSSSRVASTRAAGSLIRFSSDAQISFGQMTTSEGDISSRRASSSSCASIDSLLNLVINRRSLE